MKNLNVALIGTKFMGKAHTNAWLRAGQFFDLPCGINLHTICDTVPAGAFANNWGYKYVEIDWRKLLRNREIDVIGICTPNFLHHEMAVEAAKAGKHIFCEKPVAMSSAQALEMARIADKAGVVHYLNHNYRRVPAVALAKQLIADGKLGKIYHWRGAYLQDWIMEPDFPLVWQLDKERAGAGPHFDLGSHAVDLAQFLVGDISAVSAMFKTFVKERPLPGEGAGTFSAGDNSNETGPVTVEDAAFMTVEFANGALGSIDLTRFAGGRKNYNYFEVYGSKGSITFDFERMNELRYFSAEDSGTLQGFRDIPATLPGHPYVDAWWPPGHIIGYEHTFAHGVKDFVEAIAKGTKVQPNLWDGVKIMRVLEAATASAENGCKQAVSAI